MKCGFYAFFMTALLLATAQGCNILNQKYINSKFHLTNHSIEKFDSINYEIRINDELKIGTPYKNQYFTHHYKGFKLQVPKNDFNLNISIVGDGFEVEKDTILNIPKGSDVAVIFNFRPNPDKYHNYEVYRYLEGFPEGKDIPNYEGFVDSLYRHNLISKQFISDTIPDSNSINIVVFNQKEQVELVKRARKKNNKW